MANSYTRTPGGDDGRYVIDSKAGRSFGERQDVFDRMFVTVEVHEEPTTHTVTDRETEAMAQITRQASA